jgi:hypothetical protein
MSGVIVAPNGHPAWLEAQRNNWYEGSRWSPNRSWVWFPVQSAKQDLDRFTRYELSKHARYLYKNSPLIRGLVERLVTIICGAGVHPTFRSKSKPDFAKNIANPWWEKKSKNIHLGPKCSFLQYQRAIVRAKIVDGEGFSVKTFDEVSMEDRVQGIESDVVTGAGSTRAKELLDGMLLNGQGTVIGYKFKDVPEIYDVGDIVHHFSPIRFGQYRGETTLASAINTARDVDDILALEKQAVKDASAKKDIIKTGSGELNPEMLRQMRYGNSQGAIPFQLPNDPNAKQDYYRVHLGAEHVLLQTGDEYTPYIPNRPGSAWVGFMAFLANTICLSAGYPPSVILPIDVGGTDIRRDLDIAQRAADPAQLDLAAESELIVDYFAQGEIADGALRGAPDDLECVWSFPSKINVDRAQAQQDREDYQAGLLSAEEYHGRYGGDGDAYEEQVVAEVKRRKERIIGAGFKDVDEYIKFLSLNSKVGSPPKNEPQPKA